jgi:erythrin-vacuolar iron transport family protein
MTPTSATRPSSTHSLGADLERDRLARRVTRVTIAIASLREHRHRLLHRFRISTSGRAISPTPPAERTFLLQRAQPALSGLIDGSLSSLAPIFSVALATHTPRYAFYAGLATAIGAGVSMSFSEGLSDTGEDTGRGNPRVRGAITGAGTFTGGFLHTLPFLIPSYTTALVVAFLVVIFELVTLAFLRMRFFKTSFATSLLNVALAGLIIVGASAALGSAAS